jgi:membrane-associated protease RseP (regulator of RpoE activity)
MDMSKLYIFLGVVALSWLIIIALERMGKLKAERHLILLIFRTEKGKEFISRLAEYRRFWKIFGSFGIAVGFLGMLLVMFSLLQALHSKYIAGVPMAGVQAVIPGVTIPFWYGVIGLITVLVVHEFAHGILARREGISLKSLGVVSLSIIPIGAFVEPDEEEMKSKSRGARLRVFAVGSFGNILLALLAFGGLTLMAGGIFDYSQVQISEVSEGSPAAEYLEEGMIIEGINGREVTSLREFFEIMGSVKPRDTVLVDTDKGVFSLTTVARTDDPSRGYMGVVVRNALKDKVTRIFGTTVPLAVYFSLYWIFFLNQGIGLINLAPLHLGIAATDGHHMLRELLSGLVKEGDAEKLSLFVSGVTLIAILFTVIDLPHGLF